MKQVVNSSHFSCWIATFSCDASSATATAYGTEQVRRRKKGTDFEEFIFEIGDAEFGGHVRSPKVDLQHPNKSASASSLSPSNSCGIDSIEGTNEAEESDGMMTYGA